MMSFFTKWVLGYVMGHSTKIVPQLQGLSAQELIDFAPVYRCLHIYSVLVSNLVYIST